jgi:peptide-methionine (S)-S-oxide reductase
MKTSVARIAFAILALAVAVMTFTNRSAGSALGSSASAVPAPAVDNALASAPGQETAVFAGGCFWGIQAVYQHVKGVKSAVSGYAGGSAASPTYEEVSSGTTGHAESVRVVFDPSKISYGQLLQVFFAVAHDPTQLNRQGPDVGTQRFSIRMPRRSALLLRTSTSLQRPRPSPSRLSRASRQAERSPLRKTITRTTRRCIRTIHTYDSTMRLKLQR